MHSKFVGAAIAALFSVASPQAMALNVFACEPEWASLVKEIAPDATLYSATTAYQDAHFVQARPSLIAKLRRADMFVCSGSELEIGWLPALQMKANNANVRNGQLGAFYAAEQVERLDVLENVDRSMGDVHASGNPHVHWSPDRMVVIAEKLTERIAQIDPSNSDAYFSRLADFQQRWLVHIESLQAKAKPLKQLKVVAYHSSYRYLFDWLGVTQVGDLEPKPGLPPTSSHLASLVSLKNSNDYQLVIYADYQDSKGANWLSAKVDVPNLQMVYSVDPEKPQQADLFRLYETAIDQLLTEAGLPK
ncbi:metal ABC transporter solute-binding protein, Zn/Mn family [Echinimonas agarilytica]|uniref:Zinc ABC transporter substrate-binding protein n=1 Tax=Echinimonas agarilytica TaxID=1215918 RepID=A0AA42B697_9GAMM|nr:zinc ABC transporter substrate-binding protein [Echinimonas agarilytica]MCM2678444.1 zinc ABC transporter substrate-binding protein [Echinimonas agarilytica]